MLVKCVNTVIATGNAFNLNTFHAFRCVVLSSNPIRNQSKIFSSIEIVNKNFPHREGTHAQKLTTLLASSAHAHVHLIVTMIKL